MPRSIKLPESSGEWMRAETLAEAVQELYVRFDPALMIEATKDHSLFITDRNAPMIFFRYLPNENNPLPTSFYIAKVARPSACASSAGRCNRASFRLDIKDI